MVGGATVGGNIGCCPLFHTNGLADKWLVELHLGITQDVALCVNTDGLADKWLVELLSVITWDIALCVTHMV